MKWKLTQPMQSTFFVTMIMACTLMSVTAEQAIFRIERERFDITGRTRPYVLAAILGSATGTEFKSAEEMETFRLSIEQKMENLRAFRESSARFSPIEDTGSDDGIHRFELVYTIVDGTPFFPIPIAFYNSNLGFQGGILLNLPNVAGSLQNGMILGMYIAPPDDQDRLKWADPNFFLLSVWSGIRIPAAELSFAVSGSRMKQQTTIRGVEVNEWTAPGFSITPAITWRLGDHSSTTTSVRFTLAAEADISYINQTELFGYGPIHYGLEAKQRLEWSDINWKGNLRTGERAMISAGYAMNEPEFDTTRHDFAIEAEGAVFRTIASRFGPSARIYAWNNTDLPWIHTAEWLRGIRNGEFKGNRGIFINTSLQIKLVRFASAELHIVPTLDWGFALDPSEKNRIDSGFGAGAELMLIPDAMKNFPVKLGFAWDLRDKYATDPIKRMEVDFAFSFAY